MRLNLRKIPFVVVDLYSGRYTIIHKNGHEDYNLEENKIDKKYYGYCPPHGYINISYMGAPKDADKIDGIMVIYTKKLTNSSDRQIIAFCKKATAYNVNLDGSSLKREIKISGETVYCPYSIVSDHMYDLRSYYKKFTIKLSSYNTYMFRKQRFYKGKYEELDTKIIDYLEEYLSKSDFVEDQVFQDEIQKSSIAAAFEQDSKDELSFTDGIRGRQVIKRARISKAALVKASFKCDGDKDHSTFTTIKGNAYMEGHHLIPCTCTNAENFWDKYSVNIDCIENIVSLCPTCHRLVHFGSVKEKNILLEKLYNIQISELNKIGVKISCEDFLKLYE